MADYRNYIDENIRLIILKALAAEDSAALNDFLIMKQLEGFGFAKTPDYVRNQLLWLEKQTGAVRTSILGTAMVATLTKVGRWHVERRHFLEGIQRPSDID